MDLKEPIGLKNDAKHKEPRSITEHVEAVFEIMSHPKHAKYLDLLDENRNHPWKIYMYGTRKVTKAIWEELRAIAKISPNYHIECGTNTKKGFKPDWTFNENTDFDAGPGHTAILWYYTDKSKIPSEIETKGVWCSVMKFIRGS